jgi:hypothetical protein
MSSLSFKSLLLQSCCLKRADTILSLFPDDYLCSQLTCCSMSHTGSLEMSSKRKSQPTRIFEDQSPPPAASAALLSNIFGHLGHAQSTAGELKKPVDPPPPPSPASGPDDPGQPDPAARAMEMAQFEYMRSMAMKSVALQQQEQLQQVSLRMAMKINEFFVIKLAFC